jgi:hypothetical protein
MKDLNKCLIVAMGATVVLGCGTAVPTATIETADVQGATRVQPQTVPETPQPREEPDAPIPASWEPMAGATCQFIDVRQRRAERIDGLYVTLRVLADTTVDGNFFARVWLDERHSTLLGDFELEQGEVTLFTVLVPEPGQHRLIIDIEANDRDGNHTQCDGSLLVTV